MAYRAQRQSLFSQMGAPDAPSTSVDVPGIIDALTNSSMSFIQQAMLRRHAANNTAIAAEERSYRRGRDKVEDDRYTRDRTDRLAKEAAELALQREKERHDFIAKGGVPEHDEVLTTPSVASVGPVPTLQAKGKRPIKDAMTADLKPAYTPVGPPARATSNPLPVPGTSQHVAESFDPRQGADYIRQTDVAGVRAQVQGEQLEKRLAAQQAGRVFAAQAAKDLARLRAQLTADAKKDQPIGKAMTGNMMETAATKTAEGLMDRFAGSYDDAYDFLMTTKEGKDLRDFGVAPRHLMGARGKWTRDATGQSIRVQSALELTPEEAAGVVGTTRKLVGGQTKNPRGTPLAPSDTAATKPPAAATPPAAGATKQPAGATARSPLSAAAKAKAKSDTAFAKFLEGKGYSAKDWK